MSKLLKFGGVSGLSFVVNVGGFALMHEAFGVRAEAAYALSLVAVFAMNFALFRFWVFKPEGTAGRAAGRGAGRQLAEYLASAVLFRAGEYAAFLGLHTRLGYDPTLSIVAISVVATGLKFLVFNARVFAPAKVAAPREVPA